MQFTTPGITAGHETRTQLCSVIMTSWGQTGQ